MNDVGRRKTLGLVIPTYNMADSLIELMGSLEASGVLTLLNEVVIVDDGSTDSTPKIFAEFQNKSIEPTKWTLLSLAQNQGRFLARLRGAELLKTELAFFLDSRIELHADFVNELTEALKVHDCLMAYPKIDEEKSVYDLYWDRTHRWAFKKYYSAVNEGFWLTPENYDSYLKGTGAFICPRDIFLECCAPYVGVDLKSDDTLLQKDIAARIAIHVPSYLWVHWSPRRSLVPFLLRLFERGPGFVEYHVFVRRGLYFWLFLLSTAIFLATLSLFILKPLLGLFLTAMFTIALFFTTLFFSRSLKEFVKLAPLHVLSIASYFFGAFWGLFVVTIKKLQPSKKNETHEK